MPISSQIYEILENGLDPKKAVRALLMRPSKGEKI